MKRKNWVGKYYKLDKQIAEMLDVLSRKMNLTETETIETLIRDRYSILVGNVSPEIAKLITV